MGKKKPKRAGAGEPPAQGAAWPHWAALLLLAGLAAAIYGVAVKGPFLFDDFSYVTGNPLIRDFSAFAGLDGPLGVNQNVDTHFRTRSAAFFTFALNYALGGADPAGYHIFNIALHALNSFLVYWLGLLLLGRVPGRQAAPGAAPGLSEGQLRAGAAAAAVLFLCHPLQSQAVAYISQRFVSVAAFFSFLSLAAYLQSRLAAAPGRRASFYAVSLAAAALAMKSKENAFPLPFMIAAAEFLFFSAAPRQRVKLLLPLALTLLIIPATLIYNGGQPRSPLAAMSVSGGDKPDRLGYVLSQPEIVVSYLRLLAWPSGQSADHDPELRHSPSLPVLAALLLLAALAAYGLKLASSKERLRAAAGFGVLWFFVMNSVESSIVPIGDLMFEHRVYLPSFGLFLAAGALAAAAVRATAGRPAVRALGVSVFLAAAAAFSAAAHARAVAWSDEEALWRDTAAKSPRKARPHYNLGSVLVKRERFAEAAAELELALAAFPDNPDNADVYYNLGLARARLEEFPRAEAAFLAAQRLAPERDSPHFNLAVVYLKQGRPGEARRQLEEALRRNPGHAKARARLEALRAGGI